MLDYNMTEKKIERIAMRRRIALSGSGYAINLPKALNEIWAELYRKRRDVRVIIEYETD